MRRLGPPDLALLEDRARMVAALIGPAFDQVGAGFVLLGFTFGEGGFSTYLSNGCRSDVVRLLRETADRLEANEDMPPIRPGEPSA